MGRILDGKTDLLTGLLGGKQVWKCPVALLATCSGSKSDLVGEGKLQKFERVDKVDTPDFWNKIMAPKPVPASIASQADIQAPTNTSQVWTTIPLHEYVVLYAWREHFSDSNNPQFEWRYYKNERKMDGGEMRFNSISGEAFQKWWQRDKAEVRLQEMTGSQGYEVTEQKIDFS